MTRLIFVAAACCALRAQTAEFVIPGYALDRPLHVACLSPDTGTITIDVLGTSGEPLARMEKQLKARVWQAWPVYDGAAAGTGSLRLTLSPEFRLNGFFFLGGEKPFDARTLPAAGLCRDSCFALVPAGSPRLGRFQFSIPQEGGVNARIITGSKPPKVLVNEDLGRRPAGLNAFDWNLTLHPPQGIEHLGVFSVAGSREFVVVFARVDK